MAFTVDPEMAAKIGPLPWLVYTLIASGQATSDDELEHELPYISSDDINGATRVLRGNSMVQVNWDFSGYDFFDEGPLDPDKSQYEALPRSRWVYAGGEKEEAGND